MTRFRIIFASPGKADTPYGLESKIYLSRYIRPKIPAYKKREFKEFDIPLRIDKLLIIFYGAMVETLMILVYAASFYNYYATINSVEIRLANLASEIVNESVYRISFSGKYHSRRLVNESVSKSPDFTTKHTTSGTGIGLYMSKMIFEENMGGKLIAENIEVGTRFTILL